MHSSEVKPMHTVGDSASDPVMRALLPVGRSGWAIAAGYLALISILLIPAPFALLCGIMAAFDINRNANKHGMGRAVFGIIMGGMGSAALIYIITLNILR